MSMLKQNRYDLLTVSAICALAFLVFLLGLDGIETALLGAKIVASGNWGFIYVPFVRLVLECLIGVSSLLIVRKFPLAPTVQFFFLLLAAYCLLAGGAMIALIGSFDKNHIFASTFPGGPLIALILRSGLLAVGLAMYWRVTVLLALELRRFQPPIYFLIVAAFLAPVILIPAQFLANPNLRPFFVQYVQFMFEYPLVNLGLLVVPFLIRRYEPSDSQPYIGRRLGLIVAGLLGSCLYIFQTPIHHWLQKFNL